MTLQSSQSARLKGVSHICYHHLSCPLHSIHCQSWQLYIFNIVSLHHLLSLSSLISLFTIKSIFIRLLKSPDNLNFIFQAYYSLQIFWILFQSSCFYSVSFPKSISLTVSFLVHKSSLIAYYLQKRVEILDDDTQNTLTHDVSTSSSSWSFYLIFLSYVILFSFPQNTYSYFAAALILFMSEMSL